MLNKSTCLYKYHHFIYLITEVATLQKKYDELNIPREDEIASYYKLRQQLERLGREMQTFIVSPKYCVPFLQPGRMVKVRNLLSDFFISHLLSCKSFYCIV